MSDLLNLFSAIIGAETQPVEERRVALDNVGPLGVSTVPSCDMGYETALGSSDGNWHPVERYDSSVEAIAGHGEWLKRIQSGEREFTKLGYGDLIDPESLTLA